MAKKWTIEEDKLLRDNYSDMDLNQLFNLFKINGFDRSKNAIDSRSCLLKLYKPKIEEREGFQHCIKCNRELPLNKKYFPKYGNEKNFRHVCRECKGGKFLTDDYKDRVVWSKEDNELFMKIYPYYTNEELVNNYYPNLTKKQLMEKAYSMKICKNEDTYWKGREQQSLKITGMFKGIKKSEETKRKLSETKKKQYAEGVYISNWKGRIVSEVEKEKSRQRVIGRWKGDKNPRHINPLNGLNNGNWKGGITNLNTFLRENIYEWKHDSMELCDYKCVLTGLQFDNIHHLVPLSDILKEIFSKLNLEIKPNLEDYPNEIRDEIVKENKILHKKYGLGVCLNKEIHKCFHTTYGYSNFSKDNFKEFVKRYFNGEFDDELSEKVKSINIKNNYEEVIEKITSFYYVQN